MARLLSRVRGSSAAGGVPRYTVDTAFDANGASTTHPASADVTKLLADFPELTEVGKLGLQEDEGTAGNAAVTLTVGAGKYWRLIGLFHLLVTDANVANRAVVIKLRDSDDTEYDTITHANVEASTTAKLVTLFENGSDDVAGDSADKQTGTGINFPDGGPLLGPGEDVNITVTNGVAGDALDTYLFYIEYDNDPTD